MIAKRRRRRSLRALRNLVEMPFQPNSRSTRLCTEQLLIASTNQEISPFDAKPTLWGARESDRLTAWTTPRRSRIWSSDEGPSVRTFGVLDLGLGFGVYDLVLGSEMWSLRSIWSSDKGPSVRTFGVLDLGLRFGSGIGLGMGLGLGLG